MFCYCIYTSSCAVKCMAITDSAIFLSFAVQPFFVSFFYIDYSCNILRIHISGIKKWNYNNLHIKHLETAKLIIIHKITTSCGNQL